MSSEKKHLTLFFISVFLHFVFFINSIKVFYFMFHVNAWTASVCILTVVAYTNLPSFYSGQHVDHSRHACSWRQCINDLVHSEFPISALPCCTVLIMISTRVIGLRSLESDVFYNSWPAEKSKNFLHQRHLLYNWNKKERKISSVA